MLDGWRCDLIGQTCVDREEGQEAVSTDRLKKRKELIAILNHESTQLLNTMYASLPSYLSVYSKSVMYHGLHVSMYL